MRARDAFFSAPQNLSPGWLGDCANKLQRLGWGSCGQLLETGAIWGWSLGLLRLAGFLCLYFCPPGSLVMEAGDNMGLGLL